MRLRAHLAVLACATSLAACGEDEGPTPARVDEPVATTPAAPAPTVTATATAAPDPTVTTAPEPTAPPADEGGDEGGNRTSAALRIGARNIVPERLEVPAFLGLALQLVNTSGGERIVRLDDRVIAELAPAQALTVEVEGLQPGEHTLSAGPSGRATLVAKRAG